jgi:hypothetical protein
VIDWRRKGFAPYRLAHGVEGNIVELYSYPYNEVDDDPKSATIIQARSRPGDPTSIAPHAVFKDGVQGLSLITAYCEWCANEFEAKTTNDCTVNCTRCGRGYGLKWDGDEPYWYSDRKLTLWLTPMVGMGVTYYVGSDSNAGTITRVGKTPTTFWFVDDEVERVSGSEQTGDVVYEYAPGTGTEQQVRWSKDKRRYRSEGRTINIGWRRKYRDPHI